MSEKRLAASSLQRTWHSKIHSPRSARTLCSCTVSSCTRSCRSAGASATPLERSWAHAHSLLANQTWTCQRCKAHGWMRDWRTAHRSLCWRLCLLWVPLRLPRACSNGRQAPVSRHKHAPRLRMQSTVLLIAASSVELQRCRPIAQRPGLESDRATPTWARTRKLALQRQRVILKRVCGSRVRRKRPEVAAGAIEHGGPLHCTGTSKAWTQRLQTCSRPLLPVFDLDRC